VTVGFIIGVVVGGIVGASKSWWSSAILHFMEFVQSFPVFILALAFVAMRGPSAANVIIVIGALNVPIFVRLVRSEILSISESMFIEAARCAGNGHIGLVFRHFLPNAIGPAVAQFSVNVGWALLLASGLSFIGAGVQRPAAEWGLDIADGAENIVSGQWWVAGFPGLALGLAVLSFALAGDAIRDARDIRKKKT
jgi:peptide/nickel transport system permease protein